MEYLKDNVHIPVKNNTEIYYEQLISELEKKYPLINQLKFYSVDDETLRELPHIAAVLAAMTEPDISGDTCILLPSKKRIASYLAVFVALSATQDRFPLMLKNYLEQGFENGDLVRVHPGGYVYEYDGIFQYDGVEDTFFRLNILGSKTNESRTFPMRDAVRMEKTSKKSPKGTSKTVFSKDAVKSGFDYISSVETYGNDALIANEVMLVTTQKEFEEFLNTTCVVNIIHPEQKYKLSDIIPWGVITFDGEMDYRNRSARSDPLIAVSSRIEYVSDACIKRKEMAPRVIIDGARRVSDVEALDNVIDYSKLLLLIENSDYEYISDIESRNCIIGKFPEYLYELFVSDANVFNATEKDSKIESKLRFTLHACSNNDIDSVVNKIIECKNLLKKEDADENINKLIAYAYNRILEVTGILCMLKEECFKEFSEVIEYDKLLLKEQKLWVSKEVFCLLNDIFEEISFLFELTSTTDVENIKAKELLRLVNELDGCVVVTHNRNALASAKSLLGKYNYNNDVVLIDDLSPSLKIKNVILTGWPKSYKLKNFIYRYISSDIHFLCYGFEYKWFGGFKNKYNNNMARYKMDSDKLYELTGIEFPCEERKHERKYLDETKVDNILDLEYFVSKIKKGNVGLCGDGKDARDAKYVSFNGEGFSYFTESYKLPVVTSLFDLKSNVTSLWKTVEQLSHGDIILMRSHSNSSDIIKDVASQIDKNGKYVKQREIALEWKIQLVKIGGFDVGLVYDRLKSNGFSKTKQALNNWFVDNNRIGPGEKSDLEIIAKTSGDKDFETGINNVWDAIKYIRGVHISVGNHISKMLLKYLPENIPEFNGEAAELELTMEEVNLGKVFLLQIDRIDDVYSRISSVDANYLKWE